MTDNKRFLDNVDLSLYDYSATRKIVEQKFQKYRRLKEQQTIINTCLNSSITFGHDNIKSNIIVDNVSKRVEKLETINKMLSKIEVIANDNISELNDIEKIIYEKTLLKEYTNEDLVEMLDRSEKFIIKAKKSCYIKVARWFGEEVYNELDL